MIIIGLNILAYDFIRINNTEYEDCIMQGDQFETLDDARNECKKSKQCKGILDIECNGLSSFVCPQNSSTSSNIDFKSCIFEKYAIGEKSFLNPVYKFNTNMHKLKHYNFQLISWLLVSSLIDPCDRLVCNVTNTICEVVFETGKPFCTCAPGFVGDPNNKCGKYVPFQRSCEFNTIYPVYIF